MKVKVIFFGILADKLGISMVEMENIHDLIQLIANLKEQHKEIDGLEYAISVNREIVRGNKILKEADEIALLPPFEGG